MALVAYRILTSGDPDVIERKILELSNEGFVPYYGITLTHTREFVQAMISGASAIISAGDVLMLDGSPITVGVENGQAALSMAGTKAIVTDQDEFAVTGGTVTLTVVDGVVTAAYEAN